MIYNTKAVVLNIHKYGNSSLICNLFTESYGKVNIIAKGARTIKNPNSAILQPCNYIDIIYYSKSTRNIQTLKEASICANFSNQSYNHMIYGLTVVEYKGRNVLKMDVKTEEVARMVCAMAGSVFAKTTGAQIPIDGGNERVI